MAKYLHSWSERQKEFYDDVDIIIDNTDLNLEEAKDRGIK